MNVLIVAEHDNNKLSVVTQSAVAAGQFLNPSNLDVLVAGSGCADVAKEASAIEGVNSVKLCDSESLKDGLAENLASVVVKESAEYQFIIAASSTSGKNFMPRVAALIDVAQVSDVIEVVDQETFKRPMYAGNIIATVKSKDDIKVLTVRPTAFEPIGMADSEASIVNVNAPDSPQLSKFVKEELTKSDRPELGAAEIIVSGGRGVGSSEDFAIIEKLADKLGAAVGASRAAVDAGYVPNDYQVGQTGKIVAPQLYIAVGISGAIQHLAGMKDSKVIVAINKDEEAPIFGVADYGLVGDLFKEVPEMSEQLSD